MEFKESERSSALAEARRARLSQLIDDHFDAVWRFLRRLGIPAHLAEDVSQEVFLVAARRVDGIQVGHSSERSFLLGTAYRVGCDLQRKSLREPLEEDIDLEVESAPSAEERLDEMRTGKLVYRVLSELDEDVRPIFIMYEMDGMTMLEISKALGLPIGTVALACVAPGKISRRVSNATADD